MEHDMRKPNPNNRTRVRGRRGAMGFTLVEVMVALAILMTSLIFTLDLVGKGIGKMYDMRIRSQVKECARLTMEYYSTLPPDVIYGMSKQSPQTATYATPSDENLITFVTQSYPICRTLSDPSNAVGAKVQLRYTICPGCLAHENPSWVGFISCIYYFKLRLTFNSFQYGGVNHNIDYAAKLYAGQSGECDDSVNPNGCGSGGYPDTVRQCNM